MIKAKALLFCALLLLAVIPFFALDGIIVTVNGKVEYKDNAGIWKPMKAGDAVKSGTMISTGFKSEATVKLGASILTIKPLTRMTLVELVEKEDTVNTDLYLEVGNVKAEVNSLDNKKNGFTVRSPVATASVRGTVFELGDTLVILNGAVKFTTPIGQTRTGQAGQKLELFGTAVASASTAVKAAMEQIPLTNTPSSEVKSAVKATAAAPPALPPPVIASVPIIVPETSVVIIVQ